MTNRLELNWSLDGFVDEQRYYCSETPIDTQSLPAAKVILAGDVRTYIDTAVEVGKTYYVCVSSVKNGVEKIGNEVQVSTSIVQSYRYLRIYITANNGDTYTSLQEIEISSTVGGNDITTPSTPASQSSYFAIANAVASKLVDNNFIEYQLSVWVTNGTSAPHWVSFDLASIRELAELRMWPQNYSGGAARAPKDFIIQGSNDNLTWNDIKAFSNVTGWIAGTGKTFSLVTGTIT